MILLTYILIILYTLSGIIKLIFMVHNDIKSRNIKVIYCPVNNKQENGECMINILRFRYPNADIYEWYKAERGCSKM